MSNVAQSPVSIASGEGAATAAPSLLRQALPVVLSRAGLAAMIVVSTVLVARHDAGELAALTLAEGTFGRLADIFLSIILSGIVLVAATRSPGAVARRHALWQRATGAGLLMGAVGLLVATQAGWILPALGQDPALVARATPVILAMGVGLPAGLVAVASAVHLEAIGRAGLVTRWMLAANLLNLALGWALIGGHLGLPALGALGAAITAAMVRVLLALALVRAVIAAEGRDLLRMVPTSREPASAQAGLSLASGGAAAAMHLLGLWLTVFAGWMGALPLAAYASGWTLNLPGLVIAMGIADAMTIRAAGRALGRDGWRDLRALGLLLVGIAAIPALAPGFVAALYSADPALRLIMTGILPVTALVLVCDGLCLGLMGLLRARGDIVRPVVIQIATMALTVLLAAALAFWMQAGLQGLVTAIALTSLLRLLLLALRLARAPVRGTTAQPATANGS